MDNFPCRDCICLAICKNIYNGSTVVSINKLADKCKDFYYYLFSEYDDKYGDFISRKIILSDELYTEFLEYMEWK